MKKLIIYDNQQRSGQWFDQSEAPKHVAKPNLYAKKFMVTIWWCNNGIIHYNFLKPGETITAVKYCQELEIFHQKLLKI